MKIALEGCAHGELDKIYDALQYLQEENGFKIDLLICCGDFQAVRNTEDLQCMAVPEKYQKINTFYKYYSGEKIAPMLTLFIGGNHEASNYLGELSYGGWVCPNIYYLGYAGVVTIGGVRIAGLSGIYKGPDYLKGHHEHPPYDRSTRRSAYHIRNLDVFRLKQVSQPVEVFLSHDWPRGVYNYGDMGALLQKKPFFKDEVETNQLGSRPSQELLEKLQPAYWFSAHLHVKFAALVPHEQLENGGQKKMTKFLALDKCLPRREFLQILDIGPDVVATFPELHYDPEWLCILKSTNHLLNISRGIQYMPGPGCSERWDFRASEQELDEIRQMFNNDFKVPLNFQRTVTPHDPNVVGSRSPPSAQINPQTTEFCAKLGITDPYQKILGGIDAAKISVCQFSFINDSEANVTCSSPNVSLNISSNPNGVSLDSEGRSDLEDVEDEPSSGDRIDSSTQGTQSDVSYSQSTNPDEISLDDSDDGYDESVDLSSPCPLTSTPAAKNVEGISSRLAGGTGRSSISGTLPEGHAPENLDPSPQVCSSTETAENTAAVHQSDEGSDQNISAARAQRPIKKLKRRNQAIYAAQDDNSDDS